MEIDSESEQALLCRSVFARFSLPVYFLEQIHFNGTM